MTIHSDQSITAEEIHHRDLWIAGAERTSGGSRRIEVINPATGRVWATLADADPSDVDAAVAAARNAARGPWSTTDALRVKTMLRLADLIDGHAEDLARLDVQDNGKILRECVGQVRGITRWYRFYAGLADKIQGATMPTGRISSTTFTVREPLGVIACITAWNSPLLLAAVKLAPALAAGNTVVLKPSEYASNSTLAFARLCSEAGMPDGVVNVITGGAEPAAALVRHPGVEHVSFTGSPQVGSKVAEAAGANLKDVTLELGGKSPNIIFDDASLDAALPAVLGGIFAAAGQSCVAGSRVLVQRSISEEVISRLCQRAADVVVGEPLDDRTEMGPIANQAQLNKVEEYVRIAAAEGGTLVHGGDRPADPILRDGLYFLPTIFSDVAPSSRLAQEEVFGPILAVITFEDENEAVEIANGTNYGLAAGVWTSDLGRAHRMVRRLECGTVFVNTYRAMSPDMPVGGYKRSGIGRENGIDAVLDFTRVKSVWIETEPPTDDPFKMRI